MLTSTRSGGEEQAVCKFGTLPPGACRRLDCFRRAEPLCSSEPSRSSAKASFGLCFAPIAASSCSAPFAPTLTTGMAKASIPPCRCESHTIQSESCRCWRRCSQEHNNCCILSVCGCARNVVVVQETFLAQPNLREETALFCQGVIVSYKWPKNVSGHSCCRSRQ